MKEAIKQFIEMMESRLSECMTFSDTIGYYAYKEMTNTNEYQALKALIEPEAKEQTLLELIRKKHPAMYAQANDEAIWLAQVISEYLEGNK